MRFLDATFLERPRLSTLTASHLFKVVGAGTAMPRLTLVASGQCGLRSSVSASIVWLGTTSQPGAPSHPAAFSASGRSTGRGIASMVVRPGAFPRTRCGSLQGAVLGVMLQEATMVALVHTCADSVLVAMAKMTTTVVTARTSLAR
jgi:hypothetical protein